MSCRLFIATDTEQGQWVTAASCRGCREGYGEAHEYHANSYVTKPVNFDEFSQLLRDLAFYWLVWNKRP